MIASLLALCAVVTVLPTNQVSFADITAAHERISAECARYSYQYKHVNSNQKFKNGRKITLIMSGQYLEYVEDNTAIPAQTKDPIRVYGINDSYVYSMSRKSAAEPWVVEGVEEVTQSQLVPYVMLREANLAPSLSCCFLGKPLSAWSQTGEMTFSTPKVEGEQVYLDFVFVPKDPKWTNFRAPHIKGTLKMNSRHAYRIEEWNMTLDRSRGVGQPILIPTKIIVEYFSDKPFIVKRTHLAQGDDKRPGHQEEAVVTSVTEEDTSAERFTLTHYGLPEPPWVVQRARPWWSMPWFLWIGGIAFGCLILGFFFKRFAWRSAAT